MNISGAGKNKKGENAQEEIISDPFMLLGEMEEGESSAKVAATVGRSISYGDVKCSFTVSIVCPQSKACMDRAAELCFTTALQYVNDGMSHLAPELPAIEYKKE